MQIVSWRQSNLFKPDFYERNSRTINSAATLHQMIRIRYIPGTWCWRRFFHSDQYSKPMQMHILLRLHQEMLVLYSMRNIVYIPKYRRVQIKTKTLYLSINIGWLLHATHTDVWLNRCLNYIATNEWNRIQFDNLGVLLHRRIRRSFPSTCVHTSIIANEIQYILQIHFS